MDFYKQKDGIKRMQNFFFLSTLRTITVSYSDGTIRKDRTESIRRYRATKIILENLHLNNANFFLNTEICLISKISNALEATVQKSCFICLIISNVR